MVGRNRLKGLLARLALVAMATVCFARLAAHPSALLVDAERPSIDDQRRGGNRAPGNDLTRLFLPHHMNVADQVERLGRPAFWDASGFGGRPALGNPQSGLLYPPVWLAWWSGHPASLGWVSFGHVLWAGIGTYCLARTAGLQWFGALVAAGCFQSAPYLIAQTFEGHYPHVWAACWYPWAFWATLHLRRGPGLRGMLLAPILAMAFLTGHPQEWYYLIVALGIWAILDVASRFRSGDPTAAGGLAVRWATPILLSLGLIGLELVPDLLAQQWSLPASRMSLKEASRYHWSPINLLQLVSPSALGGPWDFIGHDNYWETLLSIGLVPLVFALVGIRQAEDRRAARGWLALVVLSILFAAGRRLGLFALFYEVVPGMDRFRVPSRSLFLASLGAAMLAGMGAESLAVGPIMTDRGRSLAYRWRQFSLSLATVVLLGFVVAELVGPEEPVANPAVNAPASQRPSRPNRQRELTRWMLATRNLAEDPVFWAALAGSTAGLAIWAKGGRHRRSVVYALAALAGLELTVNGVRTLRVAPIDRNRPIDQLGLEMARILPPGAGPYRVRADSALLEHVPELSSHYELTDIPDWFQIRHAADLYESLYRSTPHDGPSVSDPKTSASSSPSRQAVLDRMGVRLIIAERNHTAVEESGARKWMSRNATFDLIPNATALPRAYVVPRAALSSGDPAAVLTELSSVDPRQAVLMALDPLGETGARQPFTEATYDAQDPDHVVVRVETDAPGLLVVGDTWMPGWTATVDGAPAELHRGNHAQRVVALPRAGSHRIELSYRPPGLLVGAALSGLSLVVWGAILAGVPTNLARRRSAGTSGFGPMTRLVSGRSRRTSSVGVQDFC